LVVFEVFPLNLLGHFDWMLSGSFKWLKTQIAGKWHVELIIFIVNDLQKLFTVYNFVVSFPRLC